ncbi:MAG TPA: acetyl-CoA carboxylase biotin carboxylase subunit, partial [Gammaproteobacteria bacterium]|nr:acetyl-CoA carboxylase biotin carboxylase subunit [Gammaproteobacteria bacterium]
CAGIRVDNGVKVGDVIGIDYDPMIAKIIAYDTDATAAWSKLHTALMQTWLAGPKTNLSFLSNLSDAALSG